MVVLFLKNRYTKRKRLWQEGVMQLEQRKPTHNPSSYERDGVFFDRDRFEVHNPITPVHMEGSPESHPHTTIQACCTFWIASLSSGTSFGSGSGSGALGYGLELI